MCSLGCEECSLPTSSIIDKLSCNIEGSDGAAYIIQTHSSKFLKRNLTAIKYRKNIILFQKYAAHFLDITHAIPEPFIFFGSLEAQCTARLSLNVGQVANLPSASVMLVSVSVMMSIC